MALINTQAFTNLAGTTWDAALESNKRMKTIAANTALTLSNVPANYEALLEVTQGGAGGYSLTINGTSISLKATGSTMIGILNVGGTLRYYPEGSGAAASTAAAAPTAFVANDSANTADFTFNPLFTSLGDYEITLDGGASFATLAAKPFNVGNTAYATGTVGFRVKAATGRVASDWLYNTTAFTTSGVTTLTFNLTSGTVSNSPVGRWNLGLNAAVSCSTHSMAGDGYFRFNVQGLGDSVVMGLDTGSAVEFYQGGDQILDYDFAVFKYAGYLYVGKLNDNLNTPTSVGSVGSYTHWGLRRSGTTLVFEASTDGYNYSTLHTYPVTSSATLYAKASSAGTTTYFQDVKVLGFA